MTVRCRLTNGCRLGSPGTVPRFPEKLKYCWSAVKFGSDESAAARGWKGGAKPVACWLGAV